MSESCQREEYLELSERRQNEHIKVWVSEDGMSNVFPPRELIGLNPFFLLSQNIKPLFTETPVNNTSFTNTLFLHAVKGTKAK